MSEAEKIDRVERRKRAEMRLARSRPEREAVAAAHAARIGVKLGSGALETERTVSSPDGNEMPAPSSLETKILDAANDILVSKGGEGRKIADQVRSFVAAHQPT